MANGSTILLVEDNEQDEVLTVRALKRHNINNPIVITRDGEEALDYLFGRGKFEENGAAAKPHLILLDLKLPKVDGLQVLREIRNNPITRSFPVVVLTTSKEDSDILTAYDLGTNAYVRKPVDFTEFSDAIRQLGLFWLLLNESAPVKI
ncbi:MAG: response regulator [Proteobacteria bacterium]|nr:MAG: response regulator [Pseudomonadota bacterium]